MFELLNWFQEKNKKLKWKNVADVISSDMLLQSLRARRENAPTPLVFSRTCGTDKRSLAEYLKVCR